MLMLRPVPLHRPVLVRPQLGDFHFANVPSSVPWLGAGLAAYLASDALLPTPFSLIGKLGGLALGLYGLSNLFSEKPAAPQASAGFESVPPGQDLARIRGRIVSPRAGETITITRSMFFPFLQSSVYFNVKVELTNTGGQVVVPLMVGLFQPQQKNSVGLAKRGVPLLAGETKVVDVAMTLDELRGDPGGLRNDTPTQIQAGLATDVATLKARLLDEIGGVVVREETTFP